MKRFLVVLLSLGLVMAFSMSAFAVTPDFTGQYYVRGNYYSNPSLLQANGGNNTSFSDVDQRLRTFFRLKIAEGLTLTTRMEALETMWGRDQYPTRGLADVTSAKAMRDYNQANLSFEQVWVNFKTGIGTFDVGYKTGTQYGWGTDFLNAPGTAPGIVWTNTFGGFEVLAGWNKTGKGDFTSSKTWNPAVQTGTKSAAPLYSESDADKDYYNLGVKSKFKGGDAGLLVTNFRYADKSSGAAGVKTDAYVLDPYMRMKLGPVDFETEGYYGFGKVKAEDGSTASDSDYKMWGIYANAKYNMGPAYVGGKFVYMSGSDPKTTDHGMISEFSYSSNSDLWGTVTPTILFGYGYHGAGLADGIVPTAANDLRGGKMDNTTLATLYGGYAVTKKLDTDVRVTYAKANEDGAATGWQSKDYGTELDARVSYKIYDKLTYNVGAAYLWTGDYFKGTSPTAKVDNVYYVSHWIDLRF